MAVLARVTLPNRTRLIVLGAGAVALLLNLCVSGGIAFSSVAAPFWAVLALGLNIVQPLPANGAAPRGVLRFAPVLLLPVAVVYALMVYLPVTSAFGDARQASRALADLASPTARSLGPGPHFQRVEHEVIAPLKAAIEADPGNARLHLLLAEGTMELAKISQAVKAKGADAFGRDALAAAQRAQELDPENTLPYLWRSSLWRTMAEWPGEDAAAHLVNALAEVRQAEPNNPTAPGLPYQLADLGFKAARQLNEQAGKEPSADRAAELRRRARAIASQANQDAEEALRLDRATTFPVRKLTDRERGQLRRWLAGEGE